MPSARVEEVVCATLKRPAEFEPPVMRQRKLNHFLKTYGPAALPVGPELAAMMGKFHFVVDGWNDDTQEIYAIPEIRKFYKYFHRVWPYWFYFCDLHPEPLQMMAFCLRPNLKGFNRFYQVDHDERRHTIAYFGIDLLFFPCDVTTAIGIGR